MNKYTLKGKNVPSSKNSKRIVRGRIIHNKLTMDYKAFSATFFKSNRDKFREEVKGRQKPIKVGFLLYRDSKRRFDYINILQIIQDLMVEHGWIDDDNMDELIPVIEGYIVTNKENSGFSLWIID